VTALRLHNLRRLESAKLNSRDQEGRLQVARSAGDAYYLTRGLRRAAVALPAEALAAFDRRVNEVPHRSRNSMLVEAVRHFMTCEEAEWRAGDQPPSDS
jgi:hypothetical protein